jgi:hypothetical protein
VVSAKYNQHTPFGSFDLLLLLKSHQKPKQTPPKTLQPLLFASIIAIDMDANYLYCLVNGKIYRTHGLEYKEINIQRTPHTMETIQNTIYYSNNIAAHMMSREQSINGLWFVAVEAM